MSISRRVPAIIIVLSALLTDKHSGHSDYLGETPEGPESLKRQCPWRHQETLPPSPNGMYTPITLLILAEFQVSPRPPVPRTEVQSILFSSSFKKPQYVKLN